MNNDQDIMKRIRAAIDDCTRGVEEAPSLQHRIARKAKGEEPVVKKISTSAILAIALVIVTMTAALAAGFGLFGELAQNQHADQRLGQLEEAAETMALSLVTEDGITIEIGQAYYEGNRVFLSYRLSGDLCSVELYEGAPEEHAPWTDVLENTIAAEAFMSDDPERQRLFTWLDGKGQRWGTARWAALHDGLFLADGTYLNIIGGDQVMQADGSIVGWKECEIPAEQAADTLTFKAVLFRGNETVFQDGSTCKRLSQRGENTDVPFTLVRNDRYVCLKGAAETEVYRAQAEMVAGKVDVTGRIRVTAPEAWVTAWTDWDAETDTDAISSWNLYQNGTLISKEGMQSIRPEGAQTLVFELLYPNGGQLEGLTLVPVYDRSGEHPDEAIHMEQLVP